MYLSLYRIHTKQVLIINEVTQFYDVFVMVESFLISHKYVFECVRFCIVNDINYDCDTQNSDSYNVIIIALQSNKRYVCHKKYHASKFQLFDIPQDHNIISL